MRTSPKKIRRRRKGELVIEQIRDIATVAAMLKAAGMSAAGLDSPSACFLVAFFGDDPVGIVGVETAVDVAAMHSLFVMESMRRHGIGAELVWAARIAAHTRGARTLYKLAHRNSGGYLARFGFAPVAIDDAAEFPESIHWMAALESDRNDLQAWRLDISQDGVILR